MKSRIPLLLASVLASSAFVLPASAQEVACPVKIGGVLSLTGPIGSVGQNIAKSAQLAIATINEGGGVKGCPVEMVLRDDQGQPNVGVDAAKFLIEVEGVKAITAAISSGVTVPVLTSVTADAQIPQISCCSSANILTELGKQGKTGGFFFRTFPTNQNLAYPPAMIAAEKGLKRVAIIYVNNDYGSALSENFKKAFEAHGGEVVKAVAFNENQASYRAEVSTALAADADALLLVAFPVDGASIAREWLSLGGARSMILNNALRSPDFVEAVGAQYLTESWGTDNAAAKGPELDSFREAFSAANPGIAPEGPGIYNIYDAIMALGLAMNIAPDLSGPSIRDAMWQIQTEDGTPIGTGADDFAKAIEVIKAGQGISYVGATGAVNFDQYGDVKGPALVWSVAEDGTLTIDREIDLREMDDLFRKVDG
jgi:branched-chain amino acid transport system substrate-binding protein